MVARFHREARVASMLAHPHVVEVFVTGQLPPGSPGAGALYIVMEHVDGISLRSALAARGGAIQLPRALRIVLQLCDAVGEAHARGIVHRDIKPENVMLVRRGGDPDFVKVLDFGMARMPAGSGPVLTKAGLIFGTARYISPEGAAGQPVGPPGDVYAIATVLYQTLAGCTPFEGETCSRGPGPPDQRATRRRCARTRAARTSPSPSPRSSPKISPNNRRSETPDARALARALLDAARAAGLAPEALVARSAFLGEPAHEPAFVSAEPTRQLEFGGGLPRRTDDARPGDGRRIAAHESHANSASEALHRKPRSLASVRAAPSLFCSDAWPAAWRSRRSASVCAPTARRKVRRTAAPDAVARGQGPVTLIGADAGARSADGGLSIRSAP